LPTDALGPLQPSSVPDPAVALTRPPAPRAPAFADFLKTKLADPQAEISQVRSEIASIRDGGILRYAAPSASARAGAAKTVTSAAGAAGSPTSKMMNLQASTGPDPYGWRAMARNAGESIVGQGFGSVFERQINQESGFAPDVVMGARTSSAGAEGIAQLMPQYYPGVDRTDPQQSLVAAAQSMRHYLEAWDGDVRKSLASYNAGLGRVRANVQAHGENWEAALPQETRDYLAAILGPAAPTYPLAPGHAAAVFGGRGPGGVLTSPLDHVSQQRQVNSMLEMIAPSGSTVRAPADGRVTAVSPTADGSQSVTIDHGNGWRTVLEGLDGLQVAQGANVRRSEALGTLLGTNGTLAMLGLGVTLDGRAVDPSRYLWNAQP
jgi:murein DD-endopeptidase MepM/ murein hydrolase activator NlpD